MATEVLEKRILRYLEDLAPDGRVIIKIDTLSSALSEPKGPIYNAIEQLRKAKKFKSFSRGRMGLEIIFPHYKPDSSSIIEDIKEETSTPIKSVNTVLELLNQWKSSSDQFKAVNLALDMLNQLSSEQLKFIQAQIPRLISDKESK